MQGLGLTSRRGRRIACAWFSTAVLAAGANADWVVRPVSLNSGVGVSTATVMVAPDGEIAVGYVTPGMSAGPLGIARLGTDPLFSRKIAPASASTASFAMDAWGTVSYLTSSGVFGQDLGGWGNISEGLLQPSGTATSPATLAVNSHGIPAMVMRDSAGLETLGQFDVPSATWGYQTLPVPPSGNTSPQGFVFDSASRPALSYSAGNSLLTIARQTSSGGWYSLNVPAAGDGGTNSAIAAHGNEIGFAYMGSSGLMFGREEGGVVQTEVISGGPSLVASHGLSYDAAGNPAVVYYDYSNGGSLNLSRRSSSGQWTHQTLPDAAPAGTVQYASLAFNAAGEPVIAVASTAGAVLIGQNLPTLARGDFDLNRTVTEADIPGLVQSLRHQNEYLAAHPGVDAADLLPIGDCTKDFKFDDADSRAFLNGLPAVSPSASALLTRKAGYIAIDQADADPRIGTGNGNFFHVTLAGGRVYRAGDGAADVSGSLAGTPDGIVDARDIDYIHSQITIGNTVCDLNGDGLVTSADVRYLVTDVIGSWPADINLDRAVNAADLNVILTNYNKAIATWDGGDLNLDGRVDAADLNLVLTYYNRSAATVINAALDPQTVSRLAEYGITVIPEPASTAMLVGIAAIAGLRRNRNA